MKTLDLYLNEQLKNEEFRKEWEENQPEMDIIRAMADARISQNLTQKELARPFCIPGFCSPSSVLALG